MLLYEPLTLNTREPKHVVMRHSMVYNEKCCADYMAFCVYVDSIAQWGYTERKLQILRLLPQNASAYQKYVQRT